MAERRRVTRWLVETAGRPLSRRGVAYRAETLLGPPKTEHAFRLIEEMTLTLRDDADLVGVDPGRARRQVIRHGRWSSLAEALRQEECDRKVLAAWAAKMQETP